VSYTERRQRILDSLVGVSEKDWRDAELLWLRTRHQELQEKLGLAEARISELEAERHPEPRAAR
jgi:hypothetical protein